MGIRSSWLLLAALANPAEARTQSGISVDGFPSADGSERACLSLELDPPQAYPGQAVRLRALVLLRSDLAEGSLLQLFRRELDLEIQLHFPGEFDWQPVPPRGDPPAGLRYALGETVDHIQPAAPAGFPGTDQGFPGTDQGAQSFTRSWTRTFESPGTFAIQGPLLRFAYTTGFRSDLLAGSVPLDRIEAAVQAAGVQLEVLPFPEAGRPPQFRGDLGRFTVECLPLPEQVAGGKPFEWRVRIRALDPRHGLALPPFPRTRGLRLLDTRALPDDEGVLLTWSVQAERPGLLSLPAVVLASFDPGPHATYVTQASAASGVHVLPAEGAGERAGQGTPLDATSDWRELSLVGCAMAAVLALWVWRTRRGAGRRAGPAPEAQAHDLDGLRRALARRMGCAAPAVSGSDLAGRLQAHGLPPVVATEAAELFSALEAERFGGPPVEAAEARLRACLQQVARLSLSNPG